MTPCYQRHEILPGVHQDIPHEHERTVAVLYDKLNDFEVRPKLGQDALREAAAIGWDAAVKAMVYEDGSPVQFAANQNPYR